MAQTQQKTTYEQKPHLILISQNQDIQYHDHNFKNKRQQFRTKKYEAAEARRGSTMHPIHMAEQRKEKNLEIGSIYKHYKVMIFTCYHLEAQKLVRMLS